MREGHPNVLQSSQRHKALLQDLGKLWVIIAMNKILFEKYFLSNYFIALFYFVLKGSFKRRLWKTHSTILSVVTDKIRFSST